MVKWKKEPERLTVEDEIKGAFQELDVTDTKLDAIRVNLMDMHTKVVDALENIRSAKTRIGGA